MASFEVIYSPMNGNNLIEQVAKCSSGSATKVRRNIRVLKMSTNWNNQMKPPSARVEIIVTINVETWMNIPANFFVILYTNCSVTNCY